MPNETELTAIDILLLNNVLDALDRLFDGDASPIDLRDLLFATGHALKHEPSIPYVLKPLPALDQILSSGGASDTQQQQSLEATGDLRLYLANLDALIESW